MSQNRNPDIVPLVASIGLFLVTTAVSQWIRQLQPGKDGRHGDDEYSDHLRDWYENRRVKGRLSYENMHSLVQNHYLDSSTSADPSEGNLPASASIVAVPPTRQNSSGNSSLRKSEWDLHRQSTLRRRSSATITEHNHHDRDSSVEAHPNANNDFHPKNRNWRHFEHFNERDRARYMERMSLSQRIQFENNEMDAEQSSTSFDDAQSISSEGSGSSEEQFVWMKHTHRTRDGDNAPWSERLRRQVSNLFEATSETDSNGEITKPPLHIDAQREESIPTLTHNGAAGRQRSQRNSSARRTMSSPDLSAPVGKLKRLPSSPEDTEINSRTLRAQYNAHIMPEKLVMIRHGQSMGNINELLYSTTPDNAMPLTDLGWKQAREAGKILKERILGKGQTVHFIVSPYVRAVETFHGMVSAWCDPKEFDHIKDKENRIKAWYGRLIDMGLTWNEDSRIREQDFGNYQDPETIKRAKQERHRFGVFYYRFPHGESASDVFDRVSTFLDSLWRSFEMNRSRNYVLVTHGISIRVLLARYFRYTIDQFNMLANPRNCEMVVLGHNDVGKLELEGRCALQVETDAETGEQEVNYKFHKRLRILPRSDIRKVRIRISADDK